jgi:hypothetical protein
VKRPAAPLSPDLVSVTHRQYFDKSAPISPRNVLPAPDILHLEEILARQTANSFSNYMYVNCRNLTFNCCSNNRILLWALKAKFTQLGIGFYLWHDHIHAESWPTAPIIRARLRTTRLRQTIVWTWKNHCIYPKQFHKNLLNFPSFHFFNFCWKFLIPGFALVSFHLRIQCIAGADPGFFAGRGSPLDPGP